MKTKVQDGREVFWSPRAVFLVRQDAILEEGRSHRTVTILENLRPNNFRKKTSKTKVQDGREVFGVLQEAAPEEGQSHRTVKILAILQKNVFQKKTSKNENPNGTADPRCQNATLPEEGKSHRTVRIFENFNRVLAAHLPTPVIFTSVASRPHSPRLKDCPRLGDPNTLKLSS